MLAYTEVTGLSNLAFGVQSAFVMALWSEETEDGRSSPPRSPSECDFSHIFYARNSDPQLEVNVSDTKLYSPRENITEEIKEISNACNVETELDSTRENITEKTQEIRNSCEVETSERKGNYTTEEGNGTKRGDSCESKTQTTKYAIAGDLVKVKDNLIDGIKQDRPDATKMLLRDGCNPNESVDIDGNRPLHWAVLTQKVHYVQWLIDAGADVNLPGKLNVTPIMVTPSQYRHDAPWEIVHKLIGANCDINRVASNSKSTLHMAVQLCNVHLAKILLQYHADIDISDSKGRSPIMYAGLLSGANILQYTTEYTFKDIEEIAYLLIKANANVFHVDKFHQNALQLTIPNIELCDPNRVQQISPRIIQMLELAGSKIPPKRFLRRWNSVSRHTSKNVQKVIQWFEEQRITVKPLHHRCRIVIRRSIGQCLQDKLIGIALPDRIKHYLLLPELDDIIDKHGSY